MEQLSMFDQELLSHDKSNLSEEYDELIRVMNYHCEKYYNEDEPEISDYEYDKLNSRLKEIERENPSMVRDDSPSKRVGWKAEKGIRIKHNVPMLSLEDVFSESEVRAFVSSVQSELGENTEFLVETKIDGLSMALRYEDGELQTAVTRGDGINEGEDVTKNARVIKDVVRTLINPVPYIEIRGEVYMTREAFSKANLEALESGKKTFMNPRNCAAGTLRQLDTRITKKRDLSLFIFNIQEVRGHEFLTHSDGYEFLKSNNIRCIDLYYKCRNFDEVWEAIKKIGEARIDLPYDIDGAVVKLNSIKDREKLGQTIKYPKWAIAYKYPPEEKETTLLDIEVNTGRTGRVTPVAIFEEVILCGTRVSKATLHNQNFIDELQIGIGDTIVVYKSGEIIPKIKSVNKSKRKKDWTPYKMPDNCPSCGALLQKDENQAALVCINPSCPDQLKNRIANFVSRDSMNIVGFGIEYISKLVDCGYIKDIADIFILERFRDELIEKSIIGKEKSTDNLISAIKLAIKEAPPSRILSGLGIPNIGKATARDLLKHFGSIDKIMEATIDELTMVEEVGQQVALSIVTFFSDEKNLVIVRRLKEYGLPFEETKVIKGDKLQGLTFCVTGKLPSLSRDEAGLIIEENSGKVVSSVSKKLSYLVAGEAAGSKLGKARELGIPIIQEAELLLMIEGEK